MNYRSCPVLGGHYSDYEGLHKGFNTLPAYFEPVPGLEGVAKISRNRRAAAICLPVPPGKEGYARLDNLRLEFYFDEESLGEQTPEGWGLRFRYPSEVTTLDLPNRPEVERVDSARVEARVIVEGKTVFAERIVPTLPVGKFMNFELLFEAISQVLGILTV